MARHPDTILVGSGDKLRVALEIWGKAWGKTVVSGNHIQSWDRWLEAGLPSSHTTVRKDIQDGFPLSRLDAYCQCFNISARGWSDSTLSAMAPAFLDMVRKGKSPQLSFDPEFVAAIKRYNRHDYLTDLFDLVKGVYRSYYLFRLPGFEKAPIISTAWQIRSIGEDCLYWRHVTHTLGVRALHIGMMYRFHNNIHYHYYSSDCRERGHCMSIDFLRHQYIQRRNPFFFHANGMTDDATPMNCPLYVTCYAVKVHDADDDDVFFDDLASSLEDGCHIYADNPRYEEMAELISTPRYEEGSIVR